MRTAMTAASMLLLAACVGARAVPKDLALADRSADCSCAFSMLVMTIRETGDKAGIDDPERLVAAIGYYVAASEALSTKEHVEQRRAATLERYLERKARMSGEYPEPVRRRRFMDGLTVDLAECALLQKQHRRELDAAARATRAQPREETP